ncbi:MAG: hypothetical protein JNM36_14345 [Chitinophagales bacterium]|jgi:hypothetical protein|nr:hypothetical protein [Chitinophagales bacterium]
MKEQTSLSSLSLEVQAIEETQQGQLVGGFAVLSSSSSAVIGTNKNCGSICVNNVC